MNVRILLLIIGAAAVLFAALQFSTGNPIGALTALYNGSFGRPAAIGGTLRETTPLLLAGIAVFLALRAGLFNIGVEGQLTIGAMCSVIVGLAVPGVAGMILGVIAGMVGGALWALPAGLIKAYKGGHEVITTIMLNNIAGFFALAMLTGPLKDPSQENATTATLPQSSWISPIYQGPPAVPFALIFGIAATIGLWWWLKKTVSGYELQAVGANATAAEVAGVSARRVIVRAMTTSGAIGGLAGALLLFGQHHRFYTDFSAGYGFTALGVALLAGPSALALIPSALLFGALSQGGTAVQIEGVPKSIVTVVLGLVIIVAAAIRYRPRKVVA